MCRVITSHKKRRNKWKAKEERMALLITANNRQTDEEAKEQLARYSERRWCVLRSRTTQATLAALCTEHTHACKAVPWTGAL